jgi:hypothetical protein
VRHGFVLPGRDGRRAARAGRRAGWDGVFVWEAAYGVDAWSLLAAMAARTAEAGCTWWVESRWELPHESPDRMGEVRERLAAGPPRS